MRSLRILEKFAFESLPENLRPYAESGSQLEDPEERASSDARAEEMITSLAAGGEEKQEDKSNLLRNVLIGGGAAGTAGWLAENYGDDLSRYMKSNYSPERAKRTWEDTGANMSKVPEYLRNLIGLR